MIKKQVFTKRILTIGGATQDIYLHYEGSDVMKIMEKSGERNYMLFESGAKVEVENILYQTGGGATNSAVSLRRLGLDVSCFCKIGDDQAGRAVLDKLAKEGVDESNIIISKEHATGRSFVINSLRRDRTIFAYRGSNGFLQEDDIPFDQIKKTDQLYITSLSHQSAKILESVVSFAKNEGVSVAINPGISQLSYGAQALKNSLQYIDIFILNSSEAKTFMSALIDDEGYCERNQFFRKDSIMFRKNLYFSIPNFFKEVIKIGPKIVVVTDGANGVYVATKDEILFHPSLKVEVIDTLGAGDAFGSCFVGCLSSGLKVEDALKCGIVNSVSVIEHIGAKPGLLLYEELQKKVKLLKDEMLQRFQL